MSSSRGSHTILIVDDDVAILRLLRRVLEADGLRVIEAESGENALQKSAGENFDIAVIDYVMPGMNGAELLQELKIRNPSAYLIRGCRRDCVNGFPQAEDRRTDGDKERVN